MRLKVCDLPMLLFSVETARHIDQELSVEDAVALSFLITAKSEKALTLCQVDFLAVCWIRIYLELKLLDGSGIHINNFGSEW